jgi:dynein heavy chain
LKNLEDKPMTSVSKAWKVIKDDKTQFINELTKIIRKPTSDVDKNKINALIIIEIHA